MTYRHGPSQALRFIRCRAGDEVYCLRMSWIRSIRRMEDLQRQTGEGTTIGHITIDGQNVPVFYLTTHLLKPSDAIPLTGKILVLNTAPCPWGMVVDEVENVIQAGENAIFPLPPMVGHPAAAWYECIVHAEGEMELALAPNGLQPDMSAELNNLLPFEPTLDMLHSVAQVSVSSDTRGKIVLFSVAPDVGITFGISLTQVPQILQPLPIIPLPGAESHILGLAKWRGVPLAVIDLLRCMGVDSSPVTSDGRLLIVRVPSQRLCIGLLIQPHVSIRTLPLDHDITDSPVSLKESLIRGKFSFGDTTLVIPDIDGMLVPSCNSAI